MKVLLDECVVHSLRLKLVGHEVFTAAYMGWDAIKNGKLLQLALESGFEALVTTDRSMAYQHDEKKLLIPIFIIYAPSNDTADVERFVPQLLNAMKYNGSVPRFLYIRS